MEICHFSSAHPRYDTRIFLKQCRSLASKKDYNVSLIVADGKGDETKDGVAIYDVGAPKDRISRIINTTRDVLRKAVSLDSQIYHFHDPELMPIATKLAKIGKVVIFDSHEDVPNQILAKHYLPKDVRKMVSSLFSMYERSTCQQFSYVVAATPVIRDKFTQYGVPSTDICNFPIRNELAGDKAWSLRQNTVCYVGALSQTRGINEIVDAMALVSHGTKLLLGGAFNESQLKTNISKSEGWSSVDYLGYLNRLQIQEVMSSSIVGLVLLHPTPSYVEALPVKMFEYMSAGLPVIASDFPILRKIIEKHSCGLCVNPLSSKSIAKAIDFIVENPDKAEEMGKNGMQAVCEQYNWSLEEAKLLGLYEGMTSDFSQSKPAKVISSR